MISRREWLCAAAGSAVAWGAAPPIRLAVFTNVYSKLPLREAAGRMKADGFAGVVLEYRFADVQFDPLAPDWSAAERMQKELRAAGLEVAGLSGYYNLVDPDAARRQKGEATIECLIRNWRRLGSPIVCTETGSFNPTSQWLEDPRNQTEEGYLECRKAVSRLAALARSHGAQLAIEPYWRNVIGSAARTQRLFREVDSPGLKLVMDPCNYFQGEDFKNQPAVLRDIFQRVGGQTVLAHAKDVKPSADGTELPAAGLGVLDYALYWELLRSLKRPLFLALEHLGMEDIPRARDYVLRCNGLVKHGADRP